MRLTARRAFGFGLPARGHHSALSTTGSCRDESGKRKQSGGNLGRLLNKGAILNADLIISVAGIPLIGLNLRAALASMETMLEYGIMEDWDKSSRELYARAETHLPLFPGEQILYKAFGYIRQEQGLIKCWVPGIWNITSQRLILWIKNPRRGHL